jgi:hypothetical protein
MRFLTVGFVMAGVIASALAAGNAAAAGGVGGKGDTGGKGGNGPASGSGAGQGEEGAAEDTSLVQQRNPDRRQVIEEEKPWEVGASWELHRMIRQEDVGPSDSKVFNVVFFSAHYDVTPKDRISAGWGLTQKYIADPGESGFRGTDVSIAYTHTQPLPRKFNLRGALSTTIPTSYSSQLQGDVTNPAATVGLSRRFGDLSLDFRLTGGAFIMKYKEAGSAYAPGSAGAVPNPRYRFGGALTGEYSMPFLRSLSVGAALIDSYVWFYDVGGATGSSSFQGTVNDAVYTNQPMLQSYGGEIFARYVLPTIYGFKSDFTASLASGAGALGTNSLLHDGVVHPYLFYRNTTEVYGTFSVRY